MKNFITKINILNPFFLIKLTNVNMLVRKLRKTSDFTIEYVDFDNEEPILFLTVSDFDIIFNAGVHNSTIKYIDGAVCHESIVGSVVLRWRLTEPKRWVPEIEKRIRKQHIKMLGWQ